MVHPQSNKRPAHSPQARRYGEFAHEVLIYTADQFLAVQDAVRAAMIGVGFSEEDLFAVTLSLEEAITNGLKHGNRGDTSKHMRVQWEVSEHRVLIAVEDQGQGFNPDMVPDARLPENVLKPGGRGLLLMRHFLSWLRYNDCGNRVTLCKVRSA